MDQHFCNRLWNLELPKKILLTVWSFYKGFVPVKVALSARRDYFGSLVPFVSFHSWDSFPHLLWMLSYWRGLHIVCRNGGFQIVFKTWTHLLAWRFQFLSSVFSKLVICMSTRIKGFHLLRLLSWYCLTFRIITSLAMLPLLDILRVLKCGLPHLLASTRWTLTWLSVPLRVWLRWL